MKKISEILMAAGGTVVIIGAMCEADGIYYDLLLIAIAFGLILLMAGMRLYRTAEQRERERRKNWITERKKSHGKQNQTEGTGRGGGTGIRTDSDRRLYQQYEAGTSRSRTETTGYL